MKVVPFSVSLMLDANSDYTLADADHLAELDEFNLLMIEQPLAHDDLMDHAQLQKQIRTPVCLDESITSVDRARKALARAPAASAGRTAADSPSR